MPRYRNDKAIIPVLDCDVKIDLEVMDTGVLGKTGNVPYLFSRSIFNLRWLFRNVNIMFRINVQFSDYYNCEDEVVI